MSNSTVPALPPIATAPIAGPVLLGYLFNWGLFGVLSVQVYIYHIAFPNDKWAAKALVYTIYAIELTQTILATHDCFNAYARDYGNLNELNAMQNEWLAVPVFSAIVSCAVQMYYAYRLQVLSGSFLLRAAVSLIALAQGVAGIVSGAQAFIIGNFADLATKAFVSTAIWLAGCAVCDIIIAVLMAYYLSRRDTGMTATHAVVVRLVRLVVETGSLTALTATIDIILYFSFPHNSYHACVALVLAKLYSNSLLVIFNSRLDIAGVRRASPNRTYGSSYSVGTRKSQNTSSRPDPTPVALSPRSAAFALSEVRVDQETWTDDAIPMKDQGYGGVKAPSL